MAFHSKKTSSLMPLQNHSTPLILIRDCYESTALTAFFYLLLTYLSPDPKEQQNVFLKVGLSRQADQEARRTGEKPAQWVFPLGFIKSKPEASHHKHHSFTYTTE
jgi:hypothetical protein